MIADNADDFANATIKLLKNEELKQKLIRNAKEKIKSIVDFDVNKNAINGSLNEIC